MTSSNIILAIIVIVTLWLFVYQKIDIFPISNTSINAQGKYWIRLIMIIGIVIFLWYAVNTELNDLYGNGLTGVKVPWMIKAVRESDDPLMTLRHNMTIWRMSLFSAFVVALLFNFVFMMNMSLEMLVGVTLTIFLINLCFASFKHYHFYDVVYDEIRQMYNVEMKK